MHQKNNHSVYRIVHFGFGAFHRAHEMVYTEASNQQFRVKRWVYTEVNMHSEHAIRAVNKRQGKIIVVSRDHKGVSLCHTHLVDEALHPSLDGVDHKSEIIKRISEPNTKIITYTITEKAYFLSDEEKKDFKDGLLNANTAIGLTVLGLAQRKHIDGGPISLISCDNLRQNGGVLKNAVITLAAEIDRELAEWIDANVAFVSSVVDRIVPAMDEQSREYLNSLNIDDPCAVICEPFKQWVLEDRFVSERPAWEFAGAQFVDDVEPYELLKLRLLNASHSFLAYLGPVFGAQTVCDAMKVSELFEALQLFLANLQVPSLEGFSACQIDNYLEAMFERFRNPYLHHFLEQIAKDGSQKIQERWLPSVMSSEPSEENLQWLALGLSAWLLFVIHRWQKGLIIHDPCEGVILEQLASSQYDADSSELALELFTHSDWIPESLRQSRDLTKFIDTFIKSLKQNPSTALKNISKQNTI